MACETTNYSLLLVLLLLLADGVTATGEQSCVQKPIFSRRSLHKEFSPSLSAGSLKLYQVTDTQGGSVSWPVRGLATYEIGAQARQFSFHCVSTVNTGNGLTWSSLDGSSSISQSEVQNGISLDFNNPAISDSGRYRCQDVFTNEVVDFTLTLGT